MGLALNERSKLSEFMLIEIESDFCVSDGLVDCGRAFWASKCHGMTIQISKAKPTGNIQGRWRFNPPSLEEYNVVWMTGPGVSEWQELAMSPSMA